MPLATRPPRPRTAAVRARATAAATALACAGALLAAPAPAAAEPVVDIAVNASLGLGTLDDAAFGVNTAIWDSHMNDPEVVELMGEAGIGMMRYPGGSYGDIYRWEDHTAPGGYVAPGTGFDDFIGTVRATGGQAMVIANYGTGTPEEAAEWVRYANVTNDYGVRYWEIGNEIYGNGHYGAQWEADDHPDKSPREYARNVLAYAAAMKAVDPTIRIGAVLTTPGDWPDGIVGPGDDADWNHTVLSRVADTIDFVIVHSYPGGATADEALDRVGRLPGQLREVRRQLDRYAGERSAEIGIALTEVNSNVQQNSRPNALFAAEVYMTALENGVFNVGWWNTHNGPTEISTVDGDTDFNDYGLLSSGGCIGEVCQPAVNTPFHPYYGIKALTTLGGPGDTMVAAASGSEDVSAHAVHQADGDLSVLLINQDPERSVAVNLDYAGFTPTAEAPVVHRYARGDTDVTRVPASSGPLTLPPYSITTVTVRPHSGGAAVGAPGTPRVAAAGSTTATLEWPQAAGGRPVRYEVYERLGANAQLLGTSTSTSLTVRNLPPGSEHTVNVLARDADGRLSRPSGPLTFTTTSPQDSTCLVSYRVDTGWGSGFVASVTVSNLGDAPINGWSLDWTWPNAGQSVQSAWSARVSSDGARVHATDDGNGHLAPNGGSTATFGFVGANDGANPAPTVFTLNGTVCRTG
ncbi:cellulose binding domain-containing protein [Allonocardiopsis opalescens]|uniref:Alpha-L-arabinofuranosidase n=1 Tax=Allonocardiopsis opalescens TaxID=1144618 RepID=A0A2T0QF09_9ACTN|nr:cellulose binding domain-containing protein [Allonocardiopsis opalescens]PRY02480.1 alpha-L-arabinofuranosidase [Allonocardiopsis opalescens]